ncbi:MAG: ATP-binding protein [Candidatus Omnitrophota bacterium]
MMDCENNFFDRTTTIDLLKRRVIDLKDGYRQNIAFLGPRYIGKTSLLRKFLSDLDDDAVIPLYLDLDHRDANYVFHKFAGSILYHLSKSINLPLHDDLNLLLESTKKHIPQTVEEIKKIQTSLTKGRISEAYRDLISLPEIFANESGKFCLIILDEFHNLEELGINNVFGELGKKIMTQKKCLYLVASSLGDVAQQILSERLSLLFGHFEVVHVGPFDLKTSQEFIEYNLRNIIIKPLLKNFLIDFTGGHPFYINMLCQELIRLSILHNQCEVYLPLLSQAIENTIFSRWGILSRHFDLMMHHLSFSKANAAVPRLLLALAHGQNKLQDLVDATHLKKTFITQKLNRLIDLGILDKNGNYYHYVDKLLKYWIKYVFQKRMSMIDSTTQRQKELFQKELESLVHDFTLISERDLSARIIELLHCFDNEAFTINGRRYKLPLFREINPMNRKKNTYESFDIIKAESTEDVWFIILKESSLFENEMDAFLAESKRTSQKKQKRVVISLSDLEANVRLRALQERMWIWSENELNTLLSLYDKPYIVR